MSNGKPKASMLRRTYKSLKDISENTMRLFFANKNIFRRGRRGTWVPYYISSTNFLPYLVVPFLKSILFLLPLA
jgi:hypothetical protein